MTNTLVAKNSQSRDALTTASAEEYGKALRGVLLYNLAETFDLADEEIVWTGFQLETVVDAVSQSLPVSPTLAMRQEVQSRTYSKLLSIRTKAHLPRGNVAHSAKTTTPSLAHWIDALAQPIENAYPDLSGQDYLKIRQKLSHILRNLGISAPDQPRGCTRLPIELKILLAEAKTPV